MPIEHASVRVVHKPWGVGDLHPWSGIDGTGDTVGELWFQRADKNAPTPCPAAQATVHQRAIVDPGTSGRDFARAMGMPNGKSEAWYILSAKPDAQIADWIEAPDSHRRNCARRSGTARSSNWFNGARLRKATSSSFRPARSTPSAAVSCLLRSSSTATRRTGCSTTAGSASCTKTKASPLPIPGRSKRKPVHAALRMNGRFSSRASISFSSESTFRRIRAGHCLRSRRPGFLYSTASGDRIGQGIYRRGIFARRRPHQHRGRRQWIEPRWSLIRRADPDRFPVAELGEQPTKTTVRSLRPSRNQPTFRGTDMTPLRRIA